MSVQELSTLHKRYVDVSDRFKSSWTYHQFLQGLNKLAGEGELAQYATEFQAVYGLLKEVSQHLTAAGTDRVRNELEQNSELSGKNLSCNANVVLDPDAGAPDAGAAPAPVGCDDGRSHSLQRPLQRWGRASY